MLPEIEESKWNRLDGYGRRMFVNKWVHDVCDIDPSTSEGYTNKEGMELVRQLNEYLQRAGRTSWNLYLVSLLFQRKKEVYQTHKMIKVLKGLSGQRKIAWLFKKQIASNPVDKLQAKAVALEIKVLNDRLVYLKNAFLPSVSGSSDIRYYMVYLKENGISLQSELETYIGDRFFAQKLEDVPEKAHAYFEHVCSIIESMRGREDITEAIEACKTLEDKMYEASVKSAIEYEETLKAKKLKEAEDAVNALSSGAQKVIASLKMVRNTKRFVCVAAYVPAPHASVMHCGYVHNRGLNERRSISKDPHKARLYKTEEEATEAGEVLKAQSVRDVVYNVVPVYGR